jgi:ComF family protein
MNDLNEAGSRLAVRSAQAVGRALASGGRLLAQTIMPAVCLACRVPLDRTDELCGACWRSIRFIRPPLCDRLGLPMPYGAAGPMVSAAAAANPPVYDRARAVAAFDGVMRDLVHGFKYADRHDARRLFGRWLAHAGAELLPGIDIIVPVPLARGRLLRRQYNQAAVLAQELGRLSTVRFDPLILERTRATRAQVGLSHDERRRNVRGAFRVAPSRVGRIATRNLLLVDDVITTGATVEACARTLKAGGAARVDVLALALVTDPRQISL